MAEDNDILSGYITLNDEFTQRLKDENRYQDSKEIGDKRPILESPSPPTRKPWLVEDVESTTSEKEDEEEDKEEEKEAGKDAEVNREIEKGSPNPKATKKKNKRKNKKKQK
ncbi:hypothetical protein RhiirA4_473300 [Rhizophagus irregularis]|uniref:Uncharacterized protein n=1 Tax=Rhizophagus irregularis TaxID=588596 RepID=A0A2I1H6F9_9GLOM|nr:hypothetical protein RhiirA4_473300 [Rhizophagus irregularis]